MRTTRGQQGAGQLVLHQNGPGATTALPLLPLFDAVLLPGGFARVAIPASWQKSRALVELLQNEAGEVLVAAVPYLTGSSGSGGVVAARRGSSSDDEAGGPDVDLDLDRLHHTGTAARVLQLVRRTQVRLQTAASLGLGQHWCLPDCSPRP